MNPYTDKKISVLTVKKDTIKDKGGYLASEL